MFSGRINLRESRFLMLSEKNIAYGINGLKDV